MLETKKNQTRNEKGNRYITDTLVPGKLKEVFKTK